MIAAREETPINRVIFIVYNFIYWLPLILALVGSIDYRDASILFAAIVAGRTAANLYRINILPPEQGQAFPLRAP